MIKVVITVEFIWGSWCTDCLYFASLCVNMQHSLGT